MAQRHALHVERTAEKASMIKPPSTSLGTQRVQAYFTHEKYPLLGPYSKTMQALDMTLDSRVIMRSVGELLCLMSEVTL